MSEEKKVNEKVIETLKGFNVPGEVIGYITTGEVPEDYDPNPVVETWQTNQADVWRAKLAQEVEANVKTKVEKTVKSGTIAKVKSDLNKVFALGHTNSKMKDMSIEDLMDQVSKKTTESQSEDVNALRNQLADLTNKYGASQQENETYKSLIEEKEQEKEAFKMSFIAQHARENYVKAEMSRLDWAQSGEQLAWNQKKFFQEIMEEYEFDSNGNGLKSKKTGADVLKPGDTGVFRNLSELIKSKALTLNFLKRSNAGERRDDPNYFINNKKNAEGKPIKYTQTEALKKRWAEEDRIKSGK